VAAGAKEDQAPDDQDQTADGNGSKGRAAVDQAPRSEGRANSRPRGPGRRPSSWPPGDVLRSDDELPIEDQFDAYANPPDCERTAFDAGEVAERFLTKEEAVGTHGSPGVLDRPIDDGSSGPPESEPPSQHTTKPTQTAAPDAAEAALGEGRAGKGAEPGDAPRRTMQNPTLRVGIVLAVIAALLGAAVNHAWGPLGHGIGSVIQGISGEQPLGTAAQQLNRVIGQARRRHYTVRSLTVAFDYGPPDTVMVLQPAGSAVFGRSAQIRVYQVPQSGRVRLLFSFTPEPVVPANAGAISNPLSGLFIPRALWIKITTVAPLNGSPGADVLLNLYDPQLPSLEVFPVLLFEDPATGRFHLQSLLNSATTHRESLRELLSRSQLAKQDWARPVMSLVYDRPLVIRDTSGSTPPLSAFGMSSYALSTASQRGETGGQLGLAAGYPARGGDFPSPSVMQIILWSIDLTRDEPVARAFTGISDFVRLPPSPSMEAIDKALLAAANNLPPVIPPGSSATIQKLPLMRSSIPRPVSRHAHHSPQAGPAAVHAPRSVSSPMLPQVSALSLARSMVLTQRQVPPRFAFQQQESFTPAQLAQQQTWSAQQLRSWGYEGGFERVFDRILKPSNGAQISSGDEQIASNAGVYRTAAGATSALIANGNACASGPWKILPSPKNLGDQSVFCVRFGVYRGLLGRLFFLVWRIGRFKGSISLSGVLRHVRAGQAVALARKQVGLM
jgi:hypothetical protein